MDTSQGHAPVTAGGQSWYSSTGPVTVSWNSHGTANASIEHGAPSSSGYYYGTQTEMTVTGEASNGVSSASHASTSSSLGPTNATQEYASYAPYSTSTGGYMYSNTDYQNYYNYQQSASSSSSQPVGACQNSGAPYQSFSSFQHTGSYVAPTSYSSTYYNAGDHQTVAGYPSNTYVNQPTYWNDGSSGNYPHQYSNYTQQVANSTQVASNPPASSLQYQHQWPYYYYPPAPTETIVTNSDTPACPVQAAPVGYPYQNNQPPPPGTTSWRKESSSSVSPFLQVGIFFFDNCLQWRHCVLDILGSLNSSISNHAGFITYFTIVKISL